MRKPKLKTAAELMAELESDSEYVKKKKERDDSFQRLDEWYAHLARPILDQLHARGYVATSFEDLVKRYAPLAPQAISILLEHLEPGKDARHCERLVRALGAAQGPFDGTRLATCYEGTSDESLRWAIANTIALTHPYSIDDWITTTSEQGNLGKVLRDLGYTIRQQTNP